jgi:hypothetical protein
VPLVTVARIEVLPLRYTRYPASDTLSVEAVQVTWIEVLDCAVAATLVGTVGAVVSPAVVAVAGGVDAAETFGGVARSKARTW